ncbi:MAG: DUF1349 domain-containing protein [Saccharofermentans sp.]|nr:DUF1349 domain-containing protein [Saccharofermentans sp.]
MFDHTKLEWTPEELSCSISAERIEITTKPGTDLWQKTFGSASADNAPVLQMSSDEQYFKFETKVTFDTRELYDQCGIVMHMNENTWLKASVERENDEFAHFGSVATNHGYSDWACTELAASVKEVWYRMTRRKDDFLLEYSMDGKHYAVLRMCHMWDCDKEVSFGFYACSPRESSFTAVFTEMNYEVLSESDVVL